MLYEFTFSNYGSYRHEATIDLQAQSIAEHRDSLLQDGDEQMLPVAVIFGPNGGGKSTALRALYELSNLVISPLIQLGFMRQKSEKLAALPIEVLSAGILPGNREMYYRWDDTGADSPTQFSILFRSGSYKYRYELSVKHGVITEENLYVEDRRGKVDSLFERDERGLYLSKELKGIDVDNLNEGLPLLSYAGMFKNIALIDDALRFFLRVRCINFDQPGTDRRIAIRQIEKDKSRALKIVRSMGIDIVDLRIVYDEEKRIKEVYAVHQLENGSRKELNFEQESSGTRKIFAILPAVLEAIDQGILVVIDELDAKLHPMLLCRIIELFTDPKVNIHGAQLLFTSHDLTTMSGRVFRRDEIWFSALNAQDESVLYSLADFRKDNGRKVRNDETFSKQYLEGRYGADPYLKKISSWEVEDEPQTEKEE